MPLLNLLEMNNNKVQLKPDKPEYWTNIDTNIPHGSTSIPPLDIISFAENIMGVKLQPYQVTLLQKMEEAKRTGTKLVFSGGRFHGIKILSDIEREYNQYGRKVSMSMIDEASVKDDHQTIYKCDVTSLIQNINDNTLSEYQKSLLINIISHLSCGKRITLTPPARGGIPQFVILEK